MSRVRQMIALDAALAKTYATWNPIGLDSHAQLSNGNLDVTGINFNSITWNVKSIVKMPAITGIVGSWQAEFTIISRSVEDVYSIIGFGDSVESNFVGHGNSIGWESNGNLIGGNTIKGTIDSYDVGDILGIVVDPLGYVTFYKNGVSELYTPTSYFTTAVNLYFMVTLATSAHISANFGQSPMAFPVVGANQGLFQ